MTSPGALVVIDGLASKPEYNGRPAAVVSEDLRKPDDKRFNVFVDGTTKKLSLRAQNLLPHDGSAHPIEPEGAPPELVRVNGHVAVIRERCGDMLVRVEGLQGGDEPLLRWVAMLPDDAAVGMSSVAVRVDDAAEETMPTSLLPGSRVSAKDAHRRGGPRQPRDASIVEARSEPDGRLWLYVEWEAETAEERGEGWCGPWATASRLIEQREAARLEREQALAEGEVEAPLSPWTPGRDPTTAPPRGRLSGVPSLQDLCVAFLVENIDAVASFGVLSGSAQAAIAAGLCAVRKLDDAALELLTQADASVTELVVPDCSHALRLRGCFRLTNQSLATLMQRRGAGLEELQITGNSQLNAEGLASLASHCTQLAALRLEDCDQVPPSALLPLRNLSNLHTLSLNGLFLLDGPTLVSILDRSSDTLTTLGLRGCSLLQPDALVTLARTCSRLSDLDLEGVELMDDAVAKELGDHLPALERLVLKCCVQLSDAAVESIAAGCPSLAELSLNKLPAISDAALVALRKHCTGLRTLDVSWCRGVTDHGMGALVDACAGLEKLSVWGCTQLTRTFYDGHSADALRVIGR